jgi:hypothetical protein
MYAILSHHMPSSRDTQEILRANINTAIKIYTQAQSEFDSVMSELPRGLPGGALRIRNAGNAHNEALRAVNEARISLVNFVAWGCLPDGYGDADKVLAQSNRNTLEFVKRYIALGSTFLQTAKVQHRMGERQAWEQTVRHAQKACDGAGHFLERVYSLIPGERESLQIQIEILAADIEAFFQDWEIRPDVGDTGNHESSTPAVAHSYFGDSDDAPV